MVDVSIYKLNDTGIIEIDKQLHNIERELETLKRTIYNILIKKRTTVNFNYHLENISKWVKSIKLDMKLHKYQKKMK